MYLSPFSRLYFSENYEVKRVATKYIRKGIHLITMRGRGLTLERYYNAVVSDDIYINKLLIASRVGFVIKNKP